VGVITEGLVRGDVTRPTVPVNGFTKGGVIVRVGTTGVGATNAAPTPKLPISRDPSGIPVLEADPTAVGDVACVPKNDAPKAAEVLEPIELQAPTTVEGTGSGSLALKRDVAADEVPPMEVVPPRPPPSKLEKAKFSAVIPGLDVLRPEHPIVPGEPSVVGDIVGVPDRVGEMDVGTLKPPGLSSRDPKGMPVGPTVAPGVRIPGIPVGPTVESGDVIPIAGVVVVLTCARLGPLGKTAAVVMAINKRAVVSLYWMRIDFTVV
jgi:hypothetical protein